MRRLVLMAALVAATSVVSAGAAVAQPMPAGVQRSGGALVDPQGRALYIFKWDTMVGMSHCEGSCATSWPPFVAPPDAKPLGDWSLIERGDGSHQWAYKDKPLYLYAKDVAGKPATGVSQNWALAR